MYIHMSDPLCNLSGAIFSFDTSNNTRIYFDMRLQSYCLLGLLFSGLDSALLQE